MSVSRAASRPTCISMRAPTLASSESLRNDVISPPPSIAALAPRVCSAAWTSMSTGQISRLYDFTSATKSAFVTIRTP